ncbi:MAG: hypothetical protein M3Q45_11655 [Chloroflexota bacterium]|nr:hypothetical protein [Chloroflexota bacterium]
MFNQHADVWEKRWESLDRILQAGHPTPPTPSTPATMAGRSLPRQETLQSLRTCLLAFGRSHFDFFKDGFAGQRGIILEPSSEYPKEYVLNTVLRQVAFDLDVIERATQQRMATAVPDMIKTLHRADILAYTALEPAIQEHLLANTTVVTYFQKAATVRLVPYAPVTLIGIPFTAIDSPRDLLAIPHEVGHYVYRQGVFQSSQHTGSRVAAVLRKELSGHPAWLLNWLEEIFADIYGCLVAGPVIGLSFQAVAGQSTLAAFTEDDGEHPVHAVRSHIYTSVLRRSHFCEEATKALEHAWQRQMAARQAPTQFVPHEPDAAVKKEITLEAANAEISTVIETIIDEHLKNLLDPDRIGPDSQAPVWIWDDLEEGERLDDLYTKFSARVEAMPDEDTPAVPELKAMDGENNRSVVRLEANKPSTGIKPVAHKVGDTGLWIDAIKDAAHSERTLHMPPEVWTALLDSNGWATEGPGGLPHPKG